MLPRTPAAFRSPAIRAAASRPARSQSNTTDTCRLANRRAHTGSHASSPGTATAGSPPRAGADHVRRPLHKHNPGGRLGGGMGDQPQPRAAHRQHLRRMVMRRRVAQDAAQLAIAVADGNDHPPALPPAPQLEQGGARPHARLLRPQHARRPHQRGQPLARLGQLPLVGVQLDGGGRARRPLRRRRPAAGGRTKDGGAAARQSGEWSARARSSDRSHLAPKGHARARRHTRHPPRRTPSNATRPTRHSPSRTGHGHRARARPDRRSSRADASRSPTPAAAPPARGRNRAHPRQAACCSSELPLVLVL